ncbi:hypothetical protein GcC1_217028 [Golovinomyces cichoracearum]|uniref:Uncharacterized protein n=1 Tax=Golovinomyces cichoracearum TaxID=62708 RepID=A0A420H8Y2_9PEZI|nr:hypothetical protein GcC1_217028 [Golovinomyces cichoracearum]
MDICCDGESRDDLIPRPRNESRGSAFAAIILIRSASSTITKTSPQDANKGFSIKTFTFFPIAPVDKPKKTS